MLMKKNFIMTSFYHWEDVPARKYSLASLRLGSFLVKHTESITKVLTLCVDSPVDELIKEIKATKFDILWLSAYMWTSKKVSEIIEKLELNDDQKIIIGGPDINNIQEEKDSIIKISWEGEIPLQEVLTDIYWEGIIKKAHGNKWIADTLPLYSQEMLQSLSIAPEDLWKKYAYYETNRGCLYSCGYCGRKTREKIYGFDNLLVKEEIMNIWKLGLEELFVVDPILGGTKERGKDVLRLFSKYAPNTKLIIYLRPEFIDDEYVDLLKKTSLKELRVGIQTINENVPNRIRSNNISQIKKNLLKFHDTQIPWRSELIAGLPRDTFEWLKKSMAFIINELQPTYAYTYPLSVIENTKIYDLVNKTDQELRIKKDEKNQATSSSSYTEQELKDMVRFSTSINALYMYFREKDWIRLSLDELESMIISNPCFQEKDFIDMAEKSDYQWIKRFLSQNI